MSPSVRPTARPRGPLPATVYWRRRIVVLAVPLLLIVVLAKVLTGGSDTSNDAPDATQVGSSSTETSSSEDVAPTEGAKAGLKKGKRKKAKPVLAEPTGPCVDSDITVTPDVDEAVGGKDVAITLKLRTVATEACTWTVSPQTLTVSITSGSDAIWSSRECPAAISTQDVVVRRDVNKKIEMIWKNAKRSDETCSKYTDWAMPGWYHVQAAALAGEPSDLQFELTRPVSETIIKTIKPKPKDQSGKNKGKKNRNHAAGDDGEGVSEPNG